MFSETCVFCPVCMSSVSEGLGVLNWGFSNELLYLALPAGPGKPPSLPAPEAGGRGQPRSVAASSSSERDWPAGTVCTRPSPFVLIPNYIPRFYVKSNIASLAVFFFLLIPHQEYPITFINTCFKNITVVSCCFKF